MKPLGSGSIAVYDVIERLYSLEGQSPSITRIMAETGFTSKSTIGHHLDRLEQAGWITREHKLQHGIVPVRYPRVHYRAAYRWVCAADSSNHDECPACADSIAQSSPNGRNARPDTQRNGDDNQ